MTHVRISPSVLEWALEREPVERTLAMQRFPALDAWAHGERAPTLSQAQAFARLTRVPFGFLLLARPPDEALPVADFRTRAGARLSKPSGALLDTIYLCQQRQAWYADEMDSIGESPSPLWSVARRRGRAERAAADVRAAMQLDDDAPATSLDGVLRRFIDRVEASGVLVMVSGVVGSNTFRPLSTDEFRGFALADPKAPLVFVNGCDAPAAQIFTIAHELGHIWCGESGVSDAGLERDATEVWCNRFAAELLVPAERLLDALETGALTAVRPRGIALYFGVSEAVALRRLLDVGAIERELYEQRIGPLLTRRTASRAKSGGDFYRTLERRASRTFARAIVAGTLEGRIPYTKALRLLGFRRLSVFDRLARELGVLP